MAPNFLIWQKAGLFADNLCAVSQSESWNFNNRDREFNDCYTNTIETLLVSIDFIDY